MVEKNSECKEKETLLSTLDLESNDTKIRDVIIIIVGFGVVYYMCYLLEWPYNTFLSKLITIRSEYTVGEQLSKLYLFTIVLVSVLSYRILTDATKIKLSISFLLLSLIMYMSESNMITEEAQPIYGLIGGAFYRVLSLSVTVVVMLEFVHWWVLADFVRFTYGFYP